MWLPLACPLLGTWPETQACALTRNWIGFSVYRTTPNPLNHTDQGYLLIWQRQRQRTWICGPLIYAFIGWFLYVPWLGIEPAILVYQDDNSTQLSYSARALLPLFSPIIFSICAHTYTPFQLPLLFFISRLWSLLWWRMYCTLKV